MTLIKNENDLYTWYELQSRKTKQLGFVPTMGALHEGHLSLIREAKKQNDLVVVSVFVNPTQFAPHEDFDAYPRDIDRDYALAMSAGADVVYNPEVSEIYSEGASTIVEVQGSITKKLCGKSRPTHFNGVTTVVATLFNIIGANQAYFGQKDAQQAIIIKKMVRDLHMQTKVKVCPIVRERDGLALSSRNIYLSKEERRQALVLQKGLNACNNAFLEGERDVLTLEAIITEEIQKAPLARIDYVKIHGIEELEDITIIKKDSIAAVAVFFGKTRLIDNQLLQG